VPAVLVPGGVLRLVLPDVPAAAREYLRQKDAGNDRAADEFVGFFYSSYSQLPRLQPLGFGLLQRPHQWMHDVHSMEALLTDVGFTQTTECTFRCGACSDLATLETLDGAHEAASFYLEAFKS
jgi:hypothetical protein